MRIKNEQPANSTKPPLSSLMSSLVLIKKSSGILIKELKLFRNGILLEEITSYNLKVPFHFKYKM